MSVENNIGLVCKHIVDKRRMLWQAKNKDLILKNNDYVKIRLVDCEGSSQEHIWIKITECNKSQITFKGILSNDPLMLRCYVHGDEIDFKREDIQEHIAAGVSFNNE